MQPNNDERSAIDPAKTVVATNEKKSPLSRLNQFLRGIPSYALGFSHHHRRDLYEQFGYPRNITLDELFAMYLRNDVANRAVHAYPKATWRDMPIIMDEQGSSPDEEDDDFSAFVQDVDALFEQFQIPYWLERADRLASIGQFGLLVCGFNDAMTMDQPLTGNAKLIYLQAYLQRNITVSQWDTDPKSERFGKPLVYTVQTGAFGIQQSSAIKSFRVHHTRVIHIAEQLDQDDTFGMPRLEPVFNRFMDMEKVVGGASEMYWLNGSRGVALTADADANIDDAALADMKTQLDEFDHQLRRNIALQGVTAQQLAVQIQDCSLLVDKLMDLIAGTLGIPKRILLGAEAGNLASSQDENNFADRVNERRKTFAGPRILKPLLRMLIDTGNLITPQGQWWIDWPDSAASPEKQATIGGMRTDMLNKYLMTPGSEIVVPIAEFRRDFMGIPARSEFEESELDEQVLQLTSQPAAPSGDEGETPPGEQQPLDEKDPEVQTQFKKSKTNAKPKPLYVYRSVTNAADIIAHYKAQGVKKIMKDLHVTLMWSKTPVDWMKVSAPWSYGGDAKTREAGTYVVPAGGPRDNDMFGSTFTGQCLVLLFNDMELTWRHQALLGMGCSYEFETFQAHVTISWDPGDIDLDEIEPWTGAIELGPEIFEQIDPDWKASVVNRKVARMMKTSVATAKGWALLRNAAKKKYMTRGKAKTTKGKGNYSPDQERDDDGKFGEGGGGTSLQKGGDTDTAGHEAVAQASLSKPLTTSQSEALTQYAGDSYMDVNNTLRGIASTEDPDTFEYVKDNLDSVFSNTSLSEPLTVYRTLDEDTFARLTSGSSFVDKGYVSTSANKDIGNIIPQSDVGDNVTIEVRLPQGSKALPIGHLTPENPGESEVLIARGSTFKVSTEGNRKILTLEKSP